MDTKLEQILKAVKKDKDKRLSQGQILDILDRLDKLTPQQKNIIDDYFKRVPFSHPRWWHTAGGVVIGREQVDTRPETREQAMALLNRMIAKGKNNE